MPIRIPDRLPAAEILSKENIFIMPLDRALTQDIRPLKILILNIMPTKIATETQLLRLLSNTPLQVDITLMHMKSHISKNTSNEHLDSFYKVFEDVKQEKFDGMIITGAPVEQLDFEEVNYWDELKEIFEWRKTNVFSTMFICWGAQAGLHYYYNIPKYPLEKKMFGIFENKITRQGIPLFRGFDDIYNMPHSRHTEVRKEDIIAIDGLDVVCESDTAGVSIAMKDDGKEIYVLGHGEYDRETLKCEYYRDIEKGLDIKVPYNYFINDDPEGDILVTWRAHANLLFFNWINYYVYQETPYDINKI